MTKDECLATIQRGDAAGLRALLALATVKERHLAAPDAWYEAAVRGSADMLKVLVEAQLDINARLQIEIDRNPTPLIKAVLDGTLESVQALLDHGADPNATNDIGTSPLLLCVMRRKLEEGKRLIQHGADPWLRNGSGTSPASEVTTPIDPPRQYLEEWLDLFNAQRAHGTAPLIVRSARQPTSPAAGRTAADLSEREVRALLDHHFGTSSSSDSDNPLDEHYRAMMRTYVAKHGPLQHVVCVSHYPAFEVDFAFERATIRSGRRRGQHDVHFLALGYSGEGPRCARVFLRRGWVLALRGGDRRCPNWCADRTPRWPYENLIRSRVPASVRDDPWTCFANPASAKVVAMVGGNVVQGGKRVTEPMLAQSLKVCTPRKYEQTAHVPRTEPARRSRSYPLRIFSILPALLHRGGGS